VGKKGEELVKLFYESKRQGTKNLYIVRPTKEWEQKQGADFFVVNNELGTKYFEVKTDTQTKDTGNVALEVQIVYGDTDKRIGCALKTFPDYLFYWVYPTQDILYWNPQEINPYIVDWISEGKRIVEVENKNFFSRTLLITMDEMFNTGVVKKLEVPQSLIDKVLLEDDVQTTTPFSHS